MSRIFLIDDDKSITDMLKRIIDQTDIGIVCGVYNNPSDALENLPHDNPDIVLCALLMPEIDGISFVKEARAILPQASYVMLSRSADKQLIGDAYSAGIEFFVSKPVNSVEIVSVLRNVYEKQHLRNTIDKARALLDAQTRLASQPANIPATSIMEHREESRKLRKILSKVGIMGNKGADDIISVCEYYFDHEEELKEIKLKDICSHFSDSPKSMEQRIRRAATLGMMNMANLGLEDYYNDTFSTYAAPLFGFDQVRAEMNCIQGKSDVRGNVKIRRFISSLVYMSQEK